MLIAVKAWLQYGLLVCACCAAVAETVGKTGPTELASAYFESLITGDVQRANELSTVPFSFDRKEVLTRKEDLAAKYGQILAKKGKRPVPKYSTTLPKDAPALDPKVFPRYSVIRIIIDGSDEHIDIYVTTGENPKVIGFSD